MLSKSCSCRVSALIVGMQGAPPPTTEQRSILPVFVSVGSDVSSSCLSNAPSNDINVHIVDVSCSIGGRTILFAGN